MSSLTNNLPQLYEEEQALTKLLIKKITRLEDDLEETKRALNVAADQCEIQTDRHLKKDAAVLDLQTTLDLERSQHDEELSMVRRHLEKLLAVSRNSTEAQNSTFEVWQHGESQDTLEQSWGLSMSALNKEEDTATLIEKDLKLYAGDERKADMVQGSKPSNVPGNTLRAPPQTQGVQSAGKPYIIPQRREKPSRPTTKGDDLETTKTAAKSQPVGDDGLTAISKVGLAAATKDPSDVDQAVHPNIPDLIAENFDKEFNVLYRRHKVKCAVQIDSCPIMGNPFSQTPGWDLKVDIDPGVSVEPSIGLDFRFSKDGSDSDSDDHYNSFRVGWESGVSIQGQWMMSKLYHFKAASPGLPEMLEFSLPPKIQELCKKPEDLDRLCWVSFTSTVHKASEMSLEWTKSLRGDDWKAPYTNLMRMFASEDPSYPVYIWFMIPESIFYYFNKICLDSLSDAVDDQYWDEAEKALEATKESVHVSEKGSEEALGATDEEPIPTSEDVDALRAEILQLKLDKSSLEGTLRDRDDRICKLADQLRQARKECDTIIQAAEGIKHHKDLKPNELQKALNAIAKILR